MFYGNETFPAAINEAKVVRSSIRTKTLIEHQKSPRKTLAPESLFVQIRVTYSRRPATLLTEDSRRGAFP